MNLLSIVLLDMANCDKCGLEKTLGSDGVCEGCRGQLFRAQMKSMSKVMDTGSFMLPARRNIIWVWATVTLGLLLLGETVYVLLSGR